MADRQITVPEHAAATPETLGEPRRAGSRRTGHWRGVMERWQAVLPLIPGLAFLLLFLVFPLVLSVYYSLQPNSLLPPGSRAVGLANYVYLVRRGVYLEAFLRTLRLSCYVALGSLLIGYPTALVLRRLHARLGSTLILALSFPILAGPLVVVLGWMLLLPKGGPVNYALMSLGLVRQPIQFIGTELAVIIALVQFTLAFVVLSIFNSLMRIDPALVEAAGSLGAHPLRAFWYVIWPLSLPGVFSGSILAFSLAAAAFIAPHYLGGETLLVATTLVTQFMLTMFNWELASAAAVLLVVVSLAIIFLYTRIAGQAIEQRFGLRG